MKRERRFLTDRVELRTLGEDNVKHIAGYAAKFAPARSEDLGGFVEEIDAHAFDDALTDDVRGLYNHDPNYVLGRTTAKTLDVSIDAVGLHYSVVPPNTQWANDLIVSMGRGDVDQSSFGFACVDDAWRIEKDGTVVRTLKKVKLFDVSVVTYPAYTDTNSQVRSQEFPEGQVEIPEEIKTSLKEAAKTQDYEKRYKAVRSAMAELKWAILPSKLETIVNLLEDRASGIKATDEEIRTALDMQHGETPQANSVAVIPVYGTIAHRMGMFDDFSGGTSCESISKQLRAALADDAVSNIVLDIDSPGGTVTGVPELAAEIFAARSKKPIIAVSNGMAASAAYWIASAASKVVVTPSGEVGSIGVYQMHQDVSAALDKDGVKITFVKAGEHKVEGNPYEPLSDAARADMQDSVDKFYVMFTRGVAGGRGVSLAKVLSDFGQGRVLLADDALAAGMVDEIKTLDEVLSELAPKSEELEVEAPNTGIETPDAHFAATEATAKHEAKGDPIGAAPKADPGDGNCECSDEDEDCDEEDLGVDCPEAKAKAQAELETMRLRLQWHQFKKF